MEIKVGVAMHPSGTSGAWWRRGDLNPRPSRAAARSSGGPVPLIARNGSVWIDDVFVRARCPLLPGEVPPQTPRGRGFKSRQIKRNRRTLSRSATMVETAGFEPATPCVQSRCSPAELRPHDVLV